MFDSSELPWIRRVPHRDGTRWAGEENRARPTGTRIRHVLVTSKLRDVPGNIMNTHSDLGILQVLRLRCKSQRFCTMRDLDNRRIRPLLLGVLLSQLLNLESKLRSTDIHDDRLLALLPLTRILLARTFDTTPFFELNNPNVGILVPLDIAISVSDGNNGYGNRRTPHGNSSH